MVVRFQVVLEELPSAPRLYEILHLFEDSRLYLVMRLLDLFHDVLFPSVIFL